MTTPCFECGNPADVDHHVIPRSRGGTKTVPLCYSCHSKVHDAKLLSTRELTKLGLAKAKARGVLLGGSRPECRFNSKKMTPEARARAAENSRRTHAKRRHDAYADLIPLIRQFRQQGYTLQQIADTLNKRGYQTRRKRKFASAHIHRIVQMLKPVSPGLF